MSSHVTSSCISKTARRPNSSTCSTSTTTGSTITTSSHTKQQQQRQQQVEAAWWRALELWYNYTDRYMDAVQIWIDSVVAILPVLLDTTDETDEKEIDTVTAETDTAGRTITTTTNSVPWLLLYGIDHLEYEWKKQLSSSSTSTSSSSSPPIPPHQYQYQYQYDYQYQSLYVFLAGTCLDAHHYEMAKQLLVRVILHSLLPSILSAAAAAVSSAVSSSVSQTSSLSQVDDDDDISSRRRWELLSTALQEYINTHEEEEQYIKQQQQSQPGDSKQTTTTPSTITVTTPSWMIGRRIATLRNSLSKQILTMTTTKTIKLPNRWNTTTDDDDDDDDDDTDTDGTTVFFDSTPNEQSLPPPPSPPQLQHYYWNPLNIHQRPPYYIHYPTFLLSSSSQPRNDELELDHHNSTITTATTTTTTSANATSTSIDFYLTTPVMHDRQSHPEWCRQLEAHTHVIQSELQQLLSSQQPEMSTTTTTSSSSSSSNDSGGTILDRFPKVGGDDHHRINNAGMHDGTVVRPGGAWHEIVLFSSHAAPTTIADNRNVELLPETKQLIRTYCQHDVLSLVETGIGEVILSMIGPQSTHIVPHTASHNVRYTAHLPLLVPLTTTTTTTTTAAIGTTAHTSTSTSTAMNQAVDNTDTANTTTTPNCYIRIGDETCTWTVGQMLLFDDSYEHEVVNTTNEIRVVLLLRFWHPLLTTNHDRTRAIQYIQQATHKDQLQRYNPPLPPSPVYDDDDNNHPNKESTTAVTANVMNVRRRCMEETICSHCHETGYTSIRVIASHRTIRCACGQSI